MKNLFLIFLIASLNHLCAFCTSEKSGESRIEINFNTSWKFFLGDTTNAMQVNFDDAKWKVLDIPHDWSVESSFSDQWASGTGYLPGGIGWYRKAFNVSEDQRNKEFAIYFDGVYNNSEVWINGNYLGKRPNGYVSFQYDLSSHINYGGENVIAVKVDHSKYTDSRWYTGSGIYRDVKLITMNKCHIDQWGIFAKTNSLSDQEAILEVATDVVNNFDKDIEIEVKNILFFENEIIQESISSLLVKAGSKAKNKQSVTVPSPKRWGVEDPNLYQLKTMLLSDDQLIDDVTTTVGFRELVFDANKGFFLNGENMKLKGICMHHDAGTLGSAVPKTVLSRRLDILREMGCNAIRTSHNPFSSDFYDLCDEKGFLVLDEVFDEWEITKKKWVKGWNQGEPSRDGYAENFSDWSKIDLRDVVLRDRNHPSIIMWSIGNEVDYPNDPYTHPILDTEKNPQTSARYDENLPHSDRLGEIARELAEVVRSLDDTRPVTAGLAAALVSNETGYAEALDVAGYNYQEFRYEKDHKRFPDRPLYGSENGMSLEAWNVVVENDYVMGQFLWTGIEYLGEAWIYPYRFSTSGMINLAGQKKNEFYFRQSLWSEDPMVHLTVFDKPSKTDDKNLWAHRKGMPHWNWENGSKVYVGVFTNCNEVDLVLNGKSLGIKKAADFPSKVMSWSLPFEKGDLVAIGLNNDQEVAKHKVSTAKNAKALDAEILDVKSQPDEEDIRHIEISVVDANGILAYTEDVSITCSTIGPVRLLGLEDANPTNIETYNSNSRHSFQGKLMAYIQVLEENSENAQVTFNADGLDPVTVKIE